MKKILRLLKSGVSIITIALLLFAFFIDSGRAQENVSIDKMRSHFSVFDFSGLFIITDMTSSIEKPWIYICENPINLDGYPVADSLESRDGVLFFVCNYIDKYDVVRSIYDYDTFSGSFIRKINYDIKPAIGPVYFYNDSSEEDLRFFSVSAE